MRRDGGWPSGNDLYEGMDIIEFCETKLFRKLTWLESEMILKLYGKTSKKMTDMERLVRAYKYKEKVEAKRAKEKVYERY